MRRVLQFAFCVVLSVMMPILVAAQKTIDPLKPQYDAELAKRLGGDERGMKMYVLCILKTGPKDGDFKGKEREDIFAGHMSNIGKLAEEKKLAVAGPFVSPNEKGYRGLYIFNVTTLEEAKTIVETDPTVKAGILIPDMSLWYGSASLMATPDIHKTIVKPKP